MMQSGVGWYYNVYLITPFRDLPWHIANYIAHATCFAVVQSIVFGGDKKKVIHAGEFES